MSQNLKELLQRGIEKYGQKDYEGAIEEYNSALELGVEKKILYNNRGLAKHHLGNYEGAINDYSYALSIKKENCIKPHCELYRNRGTSKYMMKDYKGAIKDYTKAIIESKEDKETSKIYVDRGIVKYKATNNKKAIEDFKKAIELDSKNERAYNGKGVAKVCLSKKKEALLDFEEAIKINSTYNEAIVNKVLLLEDLERNNDALAFLDKLTIKNYENKHVHYLQSRLLFRLKKNKDFLENMGYNYINFLEKLDSLNIESLIMKKKIEKNINKIFQKQVLGDSDKILYTYKKINENTLNAINNKGVYKNDPKNFNDVFDPYLKSKNLKINKGIIEILNKIKITCFTEKYNNNLMWSHYGDNHKGVCLGYKFRKNISHILRPIDYIGLTTEIKENFSETLYSLDEILTIEELFYRKTKDWQYEKEWRLIHLDEVYNQEKAIDKYYKELDLVEIHFGIECSSGDEEKIKELLIDNKEMKFFKIKEHKNLELEREEYKIVLNDMPNSNEK